MRILKSAKLFLIALAVCSTYAQVPTGTIAGVVSDADGRPIAGASVRLTNQDSGLTRTHTTTAEGDYSAAALPPGMYTVVAEANGFSRLQRAATVETGATTPLNLTLEVGEVREQVNVSPTAPTLSFESSNVSGLVTRSQVENLPLNGRNFLELAKLEPGVQLSTRNATNRNFVPAVGQPNGNPGRGTRVTVDGGSIMAIGQGGSALGLSQEVVQEFQVSTVNFDLTTGLTDGSAVNVTTRSGGNEFHGTGFYFFRDHNLAAYPVLNRDAVNPDPFFQRRQYGFALGGPVWRDRLFFFGNYERNEQRGVVATAVIAPEFAHLNRITPSPFFDNQFSLRFDGRLSATQTAFVRYADERIQSFGPPTNQPGAYPSAWRRQPAQASQSIFGLTSVLGTTGVNDFRFSFFYMGSSVSGATENECPDCIGLGAPSFTIAQTGLTLGVSTTSPTVARRFHLNDYVSWQLAAHRVRFGVDGEYNRGGSTTTDNEPATLTLYSPQRARQAPIPIPIPSAFLTLNDFLQLPLQSVTVGIGDARVPQADGGLVRHWPTFRLFFQDAWRITPRLTVNYGLGWSVDRNLNYDLKKPVLLAPLLGADSLGPTRKRWTNFSPVLGFSWSPWRDAKTVVRGGAGYYYDFLFPPLDAERATLGPPGLGRQNISGNRLTNCLSGIPGVAFGAPLNFPNLPTRFTGANLLACLPAIRAELERNLANSDRSLQAIQLTKQGTVYQPDFPPMTALHFNFGIQRELMKDFVLSADFAFRHFDHLGFGALDLNHFNSVRGPVIPRCLTDAQRNDPNALCSTGAITALIQAGRATYKGLLVRADKRFSHGFQLLGSWAFSSNTGATINDATGRPIGVNLDDLLGNRGPLTIDVTHIINLAGVVKLPSRFLLGFNFSYSSSPPFSPYIGGIDFNGDGTTDDLLPGTTTNQFNRSLGREDLARLVAEFNQTYAGRVDAKGVTIPRVTLPANYWFGDNFHALDVRLSRSFTIEKRLQVSLIGEVFNLYNAANLSGHSPNLAAGFGQPTGRLTQVFGSGGPRAFQLAARISF